MIAVNGEPLFGVVYMCQSENQRVTKAKVKRAKCKEMRSNRMIGSADSKFKCMHCGTICGSRIAISSRTLTRAR